MDLRIYVVLDVNSIVIWALQENNFVDVNIVFIPQFLYAISGNKGTTGGCRWGCPPSKFPWTYTATETCYLLEGRVKVYPDGYNDYVEIGPRDLVVFLKGIKCTQDVSEAVDKHYNFDQLHTVPNISF